MARELTIFYLEGCPYCLNARRAVKELQEENEQYAAVPVRWINERKEEKLASAYDYYFVPAMYDGKNKLYEAHPSDGFADIRRHTEAAFQAVC